MGPSKRYCGKGSLVIPTTYSPDNTRLNAYFKRYGSLILEGYFDFETEMFYITRICRGTFSKDSQESFLRALEKNHWDYSGNMDNLRYQSWLFIYTSH